MQRVFVLLVLFLTVMPGCDGDGDGDGVDSGPYVVVAVDNHFHDIHPQNAVEISSTRGLVIDNQGRNLHNFTVVETDISKDIRPGRELRFEPIGNFLEPGTYDVVCRYHDYVDMTGRFIVTE